MLMIPFILTLILMIAQFGLAMHTKTVLNGAAQDGAAHGAAVGDPGAGLSVTNDLAGSVGNLTTGYSSAVSSNGDLVTVTAEADVVQFVPWMPSIHVSASGSAPVERFRPQGAP